MLKFDFKKSLGQNFLRDENIISKIVNSALIDEETLVIEIGPGSGAITKMIVPKSKYTLLYEIDDRLENHLNDILSSYNNYKLIIGDVLKKDIKRELLNYDYKKLYLVANLPYYITTPIISKFIDDQIFPNKMIVMVQKEVAMRYSAKVGSKDYGSLTVFLNYFYDIKRLFDVSRNCFVPSPNVDSSVVCMVKKDNLLKLYSYSLFSNIVRDSFRYKRKTLRNNLKKYDLSLISSVLSKYNLDLSVRAEKLSLEVFVDISNSLFKSK